MAVLNFMLAVFGIIAGIYFYMVGPALYSFLAAALLVYIFLGVAPLLASIVVSFILVQVLFYQKPEGAEEGEHLLQQARKVKKLQIIKL